MAKITFHGAAGDVTGSAYLVETGAARVLVDFGMFQGVDNKDDLNVMPPGLDASKLDAVLVTHAHLDHTGRLPLLVKHGYAGPVYCTAATIDLTRLILRDSAKVQAQDIERVNRKRQRAGEEPAEPIYSAQDVENVMELFRPAPYDEPVAVGPGLRARWAEAGHMLGSASIQLLVENGRDPLCLVFSGDLGPKGAPILKDSVGFKKADVVVLESTYGDRDHKPLAETVGEFERIVREAVERKGKILVPTFAVGRAQLLLYLLALMFRRKAVPKFPVYIDSPMAIEATKIFFQHVDLFDEAYQALQEARPLAADMDTVKPTPTADDSRALNQCTGPCLILAGAGMCTAGRILHHFKENLWRPETSVIIVGYQSDGTLGRQLVDGAKQVSIFGEKIAVKARVHTLGGFSAHAGQSELLRWFGQVAPCRPQVILTHGESRGRDPLARLIEERHGLKCAKPLLGDVIEVPGT
jgi:metallo-beta-lactamase family protein